MVEIVLLKLESHQLPKLSMQCNLHQNKVYKMLSYRRETALQGALYFSPKVEDWNYETIFYGHIGLSSTTVI